MQADRARLPAHAERARVVEAVRSSPVVVVSGETGCGKTTQVDPPPPGATRTRVE
jgi:HrpA-like RNA helicase